MGPIFFIDLETARSLLNQELELFKFHPYSYFRARIGEVWTREIVAPDGKTYQLEFEVVCDSRPAGNIRVMGSIDDGGWRAFFPSGIVSFFRRAESA